MALGGFCALAVDLGLMIYAKTTLQHTVDAAALAGAQELPNNPANADLVARKVAKMNNCPDPIVSFPSGAQQIRVTANRKVIFLFARLMGLNSNTVSATTMAGRSFPVKGIPEVVPLAITTSTYEAYRGAGSFDLMLMRNNKDAFVKDTMVSLDFRTDTSGKSGSMFQEDLTNGYPNTVIIGQNYNVLNSSEVSQASNVTLAMQARFAAASAAWYHDTGTNYLFPQYPAESTRIITIVVSDEKAANNNNPIVPIRYFAPIYVEDVWTVPGNTGGTYIRVRILPGRAYNSDDPRVVLGDASTPDTGLTAVKMSE